MKVISDLQLQSGVEIPFPEAEVSIHQPTIREIGMMSEEDFRLGARVLTLNKERFFSSQDKKDLSQLTDFDIIMSILNEGKEKEAAHIRICVMFVLALLFPDYLIEIQDNFILLKDETNNSIKTINSLNYETFKQLLIGIFCINQEQGETQEYNPKGDAAKKIMDKILAGRAKVAALKNEEDKKIAIFSRYVSILAVGEQKDMNLILNLTIYQLYDEYERFLLKLQNDLYTSQMLAGAKGLDKVEDWMKDIHSN